MKILLVCTALALAGCAADTGGSGGGGGYYYEVGSVQDNLDHIKKDLDEINQRQEDQAWQQREDQMDREIDHNMGWDK